MSSLAERDGGQYANELHAGLEFFVPDLKFTRRRRWSNAGSPRVENYDLALSLVWPFKPWLNISPKKVTNHFWVDCGVGETIGLPWNFELKLRVQTCVCFGLKRQKFVGDNYSCLCEWTPL